MNDNDKKTFIYNEEGLPSQFFSSPHRHHHTLTSTSIEREDIQQATQDSNNTADSRSVFGGSQSASASMSANMHPIVEGVERLVESDTCETAPSAPDYLSYPQTGGGVPVPPGYPFDFSNSAPSEETRRTPMAPPGLAPPMSKEATIRASPVQSYTPRPSLPGIPSIWNTGYTQVGDGASPRTPPGLGQPRSVPADVNNPTSRNPSQERTANDAILRQSLLNQSQFPNPLNGTSSWSSSFNPSPPTRPNFPGAVGWERDGLNGFNSPFDGVGVPSQPTSSDLANASWANNAFLASTLSSGAGYPSSGDSTNRRSGAQLGAIGQAPPCGQGG